MARRAIQPTMPATTTAWAMPRGMMAKSGAASASKEIPDSNLALKFQGIGQRGAPLQWLVITAKGRKRASQIMP